ncbi:MAG TPA: hypothetical protein PLK19_18070, partial [Mycobacterium sp.]|nr:hypothetical protein [Mycobacterium sp.]
CGSFVPPRFSYLHSWWCRAGGRFRPPALASAAAVYLSWSINRARLYLADEYGNRKRRYRRWSHTLCWTAPR